MTPTNMSFLYLEILYMYFKFVSIDFVFKKQQTTNTHWLHILCRGNELGSLVLFSSKNKRQWLKLLPIHPTNLPP